MAPVSPSLDAQRAALADAQAIFEDAAQTTRTGAALEGWVRRRRGMSLAPLASMRLGVVPFREEYGSAESPDSEPATWLVERLAYGLTGAARAERLAAAEAAGLIQPDRRPGKHGAYRDHPMVPVVEGGRTRYLYGGYVTAPVITPVDGQPTVVGFVYRSMRNDHQTVHEYRHRRTGTNAIGSASGVLLGLDDDPETLKATGHVIACEGAIFDRAALLVAKASDPTLGVPISMNGTGGSRLVERLAGRCHRVTLATDSDDAGIRAATRHTLALLQHGITDVRVFVSASVTPALWGAGPKDVNRALQKLGPASLAAAIKRAPPAPLGLIEAWRALQTRQRPREEGPIPLRRRLSALTPIRRTGAPDDSLLDLLQAWPDQEDAARWARMAEGALMLPDGTATRLLPTREVAHSASAPRNAASAPGIR